MRGRDICRCDRFSGRRPESAYPGLLAGSERICLAPGKLLRASLSGSMAQSGTIVQVYQHTTPHQAGGKYELLNTFNLEDDSAFSLMHRAAPFADATVDLRTALGWRRNRRAFA